MSHIPAPDCPCHFPGLSQPVSSPVSTQLRTVPPAQNHPSGPKPRLALSSSPCVFPVTKTQRKAKPGLLYTSPRHQAWISQAQSKQEPFSQGHTPAVKGSNAPTVSFFTQKPRCLDPPLRNPAAGRHIPKRGWSCSCLEDLSPPQDRGKGLDF